MFPKFKTNRKLYYRLLNKNSYKLTSKIKRRFFIINSKHK